MEGRVEARDLGHVGQGVRNGADRGQVVRLVQRRETDQTRASLPASRCRHS